MCTKDSLIILMHIIGPSNTNDLIVSILKKYFIRFRVYRVIRKEVELWVLELWVLVVSRWRWKVEEEYCVHIHWITRP